MSLVTQPLGRPMSGSARLDDRLWGPISRPFVREAPTRGADVVAERAAAWLLRRRSSRADRREALAIAQRASELGKASESAFDAIVDECSQRVRMAGATVETTREAYAVAMEAVRRQVGLTLHTEQVMGALAMARGYCVEMATGEGKTITAVLPASLEGWMGRGVHVITVNDYLARRDAQTTGPVYQRLGLSVGALQDETPNEERREAYLRSVTYAADKQIVFDFLRDRLVSPLNPRLTPLLLDQLAEQGQVRTEQAWSDKVVQRGLNAAIIDEADSVLIDEAVTPAIIAQELPHEAIEEQARHFRIAAELAGKFEQGRDYSVDERQRHVELTDAGRARLRELAAHLPPFWAGPRRSEELIVRSISARALYLLDDDYVIQDGKIVIVDRSTGRLLDGRKWQLGVHQAVEAKEGLELSNETVTSARVSYQRFFQRYRKLTGMTGTAWEVADELWRYYRLRVVKVPTHKPVIRRKERDRIFTTEDVKFEAVADRATSLHGEGRAVLIGTRSVLSSERVGEALAQRGVLCRILNATREAEEADIVAGAGHSGAVTVATNMAGRGTDILIDQKTRDLGGLVVIATERHDESRVDRQLYGRSGRQGDPGLAEMFVSLDDQLIVRNGVGVLIGLTRSLPGPLRRISAGLLWGTAQWSSQRRASVLRAESAKTDAWTDMAMHHHTR
jgi:preprotein translocase subunit SecA